MTAVVSGGIKYFGLSQDEWTLIFAAVGATVAVVGLLVNVLYKHLQYRLEVRRVEAQLED